MIKSIKILYIFVFAAFAVLSSCSSSAQTPAGYAQVSFNDSGPFTGGRASEVSVIDDRMITYTASLDLSVRNPNDTKNLLIEQINVNNGFIVRETEFSITARIPSGNMDYYFNFAKTLGNINNESKTGTDITDQYRDNVIRLENLKNVRNRYLALLDQADTVGDILNIERELERVNLEIERLEGRIQHAELSVAYSNITVTFRERTRPGPLGWIFYGLYQGIKWLFVWN